MKFIKSIINDSRENIKNNKEAIFKYIYEHLSGYRIIEDLLLGREVFSMGEWLEFVGEEFELEKSFAKADFKEIYKVNI